MERQTHAHGSAASRASTVTSFDAEQEQQSYFWARLKGQYQERKTLRRQSMLGTARCGCVPLAGGFEGRREKKQMD